MRNKAETTELRVIRNPEPHDCGLEGEQLCPSDLMVELTVRFQDPKVSPAVIRFEPHHFVDLSEDSQGVITEMTRNMMGTMLGFVSRKDMLDELDKRISNEELERIVQGEDQDNE